MTQTQKIAGLHTFPLDRNRHHARRFAAGHAAARLALLLPILFLVCASGARAQTRTFYIDYAGGSNSNPGTKASPWKTHPYMQHTSGCDSSAGPSYSHQAGDHFIFKGGVSWPAACFEIFLSQGGVTGNPDYYGVDKTWFAGGSWTRPLWDFNFLVPAVGNHAVATSGAGNFSAGIPYLTFDNLEIARLNTYPSASDLTTSAVLVFGGAFSSHAATGVTVENCYLHDWVSTTNQSFNSILLSYGSIYGASLVTNTETSDANGYYYIGGVRHNEVWGGGCAGCGEVSNSKIHDGWIGCSAVGSCHDSEFYNIQGGTDVGIHTHIIYDDESDSQSTFAIYNNSIHDSQPGLVINAYYHTAIYNNVIWNIPQNSIYLYRCAPGAEAMYGPCGDNTSQVGYVFNNIIDQTTGTSGCFQWFGNQGLGTLYFQNNICIPGAFGSGYNVAAMHTASNYSSMTSTEKATYGFIPANKYSPSSPDPNVAAQGANLTSFASGNLAALSKDASGTPWFGGAYKTRPTGSTPWDLGAFQGQGGGSSGGPPTVTITSPSAGTVSGTINLTATCTPQSPATCVSIQFAVDGAAFAASGSSSPYTVTLDTTKMGNLPHTISVTVTDSNAQTGSTSVGVTVNNSSPGCFTTDPTSPSSQGFTAQTATFIATFTITPNSSSGATGNDSVIGVATTQTGVYAQQSGLLRFNTSGFIDAYNQSIPGYAALNPAPYVAGTTYTFSLTPHFTAGNLVSYDLSETSPSSIVIATGYAPRSAATSLAFLNGISDAGVYDTAKVCNFQIGSATSLSFNPTTPNLGSVTVGSNATQNVAVTTTGGTVNFSSAAISGNADFTINTNSCTGAVVSSCTTQVKFAPTGTGPENATLTYTDDATGSPQTVAVSGTGVPATPTLSVNPTSLSFGSVLIHTTSSSGPIVLTIATGPVTFTGTPSLSGANAADFALASNTCVGNVSASSCQTVVSFTPSLVGAESATLSYTDNATGSPQSVPLSGTGYLAPHPPTAVHATVN